MSEIAGATAHTRCVLTSQIVRLAAAVALLIASPAAAQTAIKPRFVLLIDTSASMLWDPEARQTYGDGSTEHVGIDTNCDGIAGNDSRLFQAKNAASDTVASFGEVEFALARYAQVQSVTGFWATSAQICGGGCCFYDDLSDNTGSQCSAAPTACGSVPILNTDSPGGDRMVHYAGRTCADSARGADILVGFGAENQRQILMWLDHRETDYNNGVVSGNYCFAGGTFHDCELRGAGLTPLGYSLEDIRTYVGSVRAADLDASCRTYATILLSDGGESCFSSGANPIGEATLLRTDQNTRTYVIGFSTVAGIEIDTLNGIANAGCPPGETGCPGGAYFVADQAELSIALGTIVQGSIPVERCNSADDDCDGLVDEDFPGLGGPCGVGACAGTTVCTADGLDSECNGAAPAASELCGNGVDDDCDGATDESPPCALCVPQPEVCNGLNDDCDSEIDEGLGGAPCDGADGDFCIEGVTTCSVGVPGCGDMTGTTVEVCGGGDEDCDGVIDGIGRACYAFATGCSVATTICVGRCQLGFQTCAAGVWSACSGEVGPVTSAAPSCNGIDDDCNGAVDDGGLDASCAPCAGADTDCDGTPDDCDGAIAFSPVSCDGTDGDLCLDDLTACSGGVLSCSAGATNVEACNGIDDNCNGTADDGVPGTGVTCGSDVGACQTGVTVCLGGLPLACAGDVEATDEIACNGLDDDCDDDTDETFAPGPCDGDDSDLCADDETTCSDGVPGCTSGDDDEEECNAQDDDCDESIDEGNPGGGGACEEAACGAGVWFCTGGELVCFGGGGAGGAETCNGVDDDCDDVIDEGFVAAPCDGEDADFCDDEGGMTSCAGEDGVVCSDDENEDDVETCNGEDDDCDGETDEDPTDVGGPCGGAPGDDNDKGACEPGERVCLSGEIACDGATNPTEEVCNGMDDDCDGETDEDDPCPGLAVCTDGQCLVPCSGDEISPCAGGFVCVDTFCVRDCCPALGCDNEERCDWRKTGKGIAIECECVDACAEVTCDSWQHCEHGGCVSNGPTTVNPDCVAYSEVCDPECQDCVVHACVNDPCCEVECALDEYCIVGACCPICGEGQVPADDGCACVDNPCDEIVCEGCTVCEAGVCVVDPCCTVSCGQGQVCEAGECVIDPCLEVNCPAGTICQDGSCITDPHPYLPPSVLATGTGGCACALARDGGAPPGTGLSALGAMLALAFARLRGERRR